MRARARLRSPLAAWTAALMACQAGRTRVQSMLRPSRSWRAGAGSVWGGGGRGGGGGGGGGFVGGRGGEGGGEGVGESVGGDVVEFWGVFLGGVGAFVEEEVEVGEVVGGGGIVGAAGREVAHDFAEGAGAAGAFGEA